MHGRQQGEGFFSTSKPCAKASWEGGDLTPWCCTSFTSMMPNKAGRCGVTAGGGLRGVGRRGPVAASSQAITGSFTPAPTCSTQWDERQGSVPLLGLGTGLGDTGDTGMEQGKQQLQAADWFLLHLKLLQNLTMT